MSKDPKTPGPNKDKGGSPVSPETVKVAPQGPKPKLYRKIDWIAFALGTLITLAGYLYTVAPDVTLEDAGELAVASMYAGVPHPPGYPVWTIYTWLFTKLLPFSNIAWRVAVSSAVAAAFSCGLLALVVSRGSSFLIRNIPDLAALDERLERLLCLSTSFVAAMLLGFNGFMWSQAVIVEVYTLSVLSLMGVICCLFQWLYMPERLRYLYWAAFWFGICLTTHQTLIVAAMGIEVAILLINRRVGRDLFFVNVLVYIGLIFAMQKGWMGSFEHNKTLNGIFHLVGLGSLLTVGSLALQTRGLLTEWKPVIITALAYVAGAIWYFYMPIASMTNPPLNWGYPRTEEGFFHALSRGQYDKTNPTSNLWQFISQIVMYFRGAADEFTVMFLLIALIPFVVYVRMQKRERVWIIGATSIYVCLAFLLLILLNPSTDLQSSIQARVFFTASHVLIAMFIGYGVTLAVAYLTLHYERFRLAAVISAAVAVAFALFARLTMPSQFQLDKFTTTMALLLWIGVLVLFTVFRQRPPVMPLIAILTILPFQSVLAHWSDNEQRGHLFGFWFGHDMFTPPFGVYPEMEKNAILFGGTDPGRFNPTYMIFAESFIPDQHKRDPEFDRRDVYLITQNALADGTYLSYIRAHYNRSTQQDPPFFTDLLRSERAAAAGHTNIFARAVAPLDRYFTRLGEDIEKERRERGVYPPKEINTPSVEDSGRAFQEYITDAQRRLQHDLQFPNEPKQIKVGEDVRIIDNKISVQGQVAVMSINAILTKIIFDKNPDHAFYIEESFPLDWMFPHLEPFGIIMKINRQPIDSFSEEVYEKDHKFWRQYSERFVGDWISYDTTVKELCDFAEKTYIRRDFNGFKGDPKFVRDDNAQKAFSKLRSAIGGVYFWRLQRAKSTTEFARLQKECEFALKQAFAYCPYSPEAVYKYVNLLLSMSRVDDAILVAETARAFDPDNRAMIDLIQNLSAIRQNQAGVAQVQSQLATLEQQYAAQKTNIQLMSQLFNSYLQLARTQQAIALFDEWLARPDVNPSHVISIANAFEQLRDYSGMERALMRATQLVPEEPNTWYDLARAQVARSNFPGALASLSSAVQLSKVRQQQAPGARDLSAEARNDPRLAPLRQLPEFSQITAQ